MNEWIQNYGKNWVFSFGTKGVSVKGTIDQRRLLTIDQLEVDAETKTFLKLTSLLNDKSQHNTEFI